MGELSTCVDVAARTMTSTVEAMERDGLVAGRPTRPTGGPRWSTSPTPGVRAYDEGRRVQAAAVADVFAGLALDQRQELAALLDSLARGIPGHEGDALTAAADRLSLLALRAVARAAFWRRP